MKRHYLLIIFNLLILTFLASCGSGSGSSAGSGTSLVTITIGNSGKTASIKVERDTFLVQAKMFLKDLIKPDSAIAAIPADVSNVAFTISAADMTTITKDVLVSGQTSITETFSVPNGSGRYFLIEAKNSAGKILYSGSASANLDGTPITLDINMSALDVAPPAIISVIPANNAAGVAVNTAVTATFSETMDATTINKSTFTLSSGTGDIAGTVTYSDTTATFTPLSNLSNNTTYTATITTGVKDLAGNAMASNYTWTFNTEWAFIGKWGSTILEHRNDGTWSSAAGTITFNSDGTGSNTYNINDNGTLSSKTEDFTYTTTINSDGSINVTQTYSTGTVTHKIVLADDDQNVFIEDGTSNLGVQKIMIGIRMDASKTYSNADLNGDYFGIEYEYQPNSICNVTKSSIATFDGSGGLSDIGTLNSCGTITTGSSTGTYTISSDGAFVDNGASTGYISGNGKLAIITNVNKSDDYAAVLLMKKGDMTYSTAGATGIWAMIGFGDSNGTSFNANFGTLNCDSNGNCTYSFKDQKDGTTSYSSGSFTITVSSDGSMTTSFTSGAPSYAVAVGNNGNTIIVNDSLDQSSDPRKIYIGVRCNACSNLVSKIMKAAKR